MGKISLPAWLSPKTSRRKKFLVESKREFPHTAIKILTLLRESSKGFSPCLLSADVITARYLRPAMHNFHTQINLLWLSVQSHIVYSTTKSSLFFSPCEHYRPTRNSNRHIINQECKFAHILQKKVWSTENAIKITCHKETLCVSIQQRQEKLSGGRKDQHLHSYFHSYQGCQKEKHLNIVFKVSISLLNFFSILPLSD